MEALQLNELAEKQKHESRLVEMFTRSSQSNLVKQQLPVNQFHNRYLTYNANDSS